MSALLAPLLSVLYCAGAAADGSGDGRLVYDGDGLDLRLAAQAALSTIAVQNAALGAGATSLRTGQPIRNPVWDDGFVKPALTATLNRPDALPGIVYGTASGVTAWTVGDGDAVAAPGSPQATQGGTAHTDIETLALGWRSGPSAGRGADGVDMSFGRQDFTIGSGFLIAYGQYNAGKLGGYYSAGRTAWAGSAITSLQSGPARADLFWLKAGKTAGSSSFAGANAEWSFSGRGKVGAAWLHVGYDDAGQSGYATRSGMQVWDLRGQATPIAALPDLSLAGEGGLELNGASAPRRQAADAWYAEAAYGWPTRQWKPSLAFRHVHFSGNEAGTGTSEGWDPLRYGQGGSSGRNWFLGEIVGEYLLFDSNENVDMLTAKVQPADWVTLTAAGYNFSYDRPDSVATVTGATGVSSHDFGRELDLTADWAVTDSLSITTAAGVFVPGDGARATWGAGQDVTLVETYVSVQF